MAGNLGSLTIGIAADVAELRRDMSRAERTVKSSTDKIAASAKLARNALLSIGGAVISGATVSGIVNATRKQEAAVKQLEQGLASTGNIVGQSLDELVKKAGELQNVTTFGDEDIIAAQSKLVTFTNIVGDQFDKTIESALDLSARMGQDLTSSVVQLGKALNDPVKNLSALSRSGIQFSESQRDTIKALAETGRVAEAQNLILQELQTQFGGSARAARDTFGGALDSLSNAFGDLLESKTGLKAAQQEIESLTQLLQDPKTQKAADTLASGLIKIATAGVGAVAAAGPIFDDFGFFIDSLTGDVSDLEKLQNRLRNIDLALEGDALFSGPFIRAFADHQLLFMSEDELKAAKEKVQAQIAEIRGSAEEVIQAPTEQRPSQVDIPVTMDVAGLQAELEELDKILEARNKAVEAANRALESKGRSITLSVQTDEEEYLTGKKELDALLEKNAITQETYNRKLAEYREILDAATPGIQSFAELQESLTNTLGPQEQALDAVRAQIVDLVVAMDTFPDKADAISEALARLREQEQGIVQSISEDNLEQNGDFWDKYLAEAEEALISLDELAVSTLKTFSRGFGDAFEQLIMDGGSFRDAMGQFMADITGSVINAIGQMIGQWLAYKAVQLVIGKSTQVAAFGMMAGNAQAMAITSGINAFASTAAIPVVGPTLAPAAMKAALAVTEPMATAVAAAASAGLASFDGGGFTGSGPRTGGLDGRGGFMAMLHPNETVIDHTRGQGAGVSIGSMVFPGISTAREAETAAGAAGRRLRREISKAQRYE